MLPLYPGNCNLPKNTLTLTADDRRMDLDEIKNSTIKKSTFVPTPVVKIGNEMIKSNEPERNEIKPYTFTNSVEIFNLPWANDKENNVDSDVESSRAFNTRIVVQTTNKNGTNNTEVVREIVEPILKPHPGKIGRSHDLSREKTEISEPILGPTTGKPIQNNVGTTLSKHIVTNNDKTKSNIIKDSNQYNFYDVQTDNDWVPATSARSEKWKRQDDSRVMPAAENDNDNNYQPRGPQRQQQQQGENGFNAIVRTVQFLPQRIARMLEEAEKYARERILPLVSNYTPRFLTDFISPREKPRYIPVTYEEIPTTRRQRKLKTTTESTTKCPHHDKNDDNSNAIKSFEQTENSFSDNNVNLTNNTDNSTVKNATRQSYIQKIPRRNEKVTIVYPLGSILSEIVSTTASATTSVSDNNKEVSINKEDGRSSKKEQEEKEVQNNSERESTIKREIKEIRIDLPVFEENKKIVYIPIHEELIKDEN